MAVAAIAGTVVLVFAAGGSAATKPTAPKIVGSRTPQAGARQIYVFSSDEQGVHASELRYRCSLDSLQLHACPRRLTTTFTAGAHLLRVQAVDLAGRRSPIARITIVARTPIAELHPTQLWQVRVDDQAEGHNFFDLAVGPIGRVYVADSAADRVDVYNPDGTLAFRFGSHGGGPGQFSFTSPDDVGLGGVGIDPATDTVYVADTANRRIETFTSDGAFSGQWGTYTLGEVIDVAIARDGEVFTVEDRPNSVKRFTAAGSLIETLAVYPVDAGGIALGGDGSLLVADYGSGGFTALDGSGRIVRRVQISGKSMPSDIAGDTAGRVFVTDSRNGRVDVFDTNGSQTGYFRTPEYPTGVALGADALYVTTYDGTLTAYRLP